MNFQMTSKKEFNLLTTETRTTTNTTKSTTTTTTTTVMKKGNRVYFDAPLRNDIQKTEAVTMVP